LLYRQGKTGVLPYDIQQPALFFQTSMRKMRSELPDINRFERIVFKRKNTLRQLLSFSLRLMNARQVGLLMGTGRNYTEFLSPDRWDRGVIHKFDGKGLSGLFMKYLGALFVKYKGYSPVMLYKDTQFGEKKDNEGIIAYVLRTYREFYAKGIKILIIDRLDTLPDCASDNFVHVPVLTYDGMLFRLEPGLKINTEPVQQFRVKNFVAAYVPDYGAIVFNTIDESFLERSHQEFANEAALKKRLDILIYAIEMASIAHIGLAKGRKAAHIIWRKEKNLRRTARSLKEKQAELSAQKEYLRAVGAVTADQLEMEAVTINDGVYAFMDMVGSATIRKKFTPRQYFFILNLCHQIAADNAGRFSCRIDNFVGDCVFIQNASPFDNNRTGPAAGIHERLMLMVFALSSIFNEIYLLQKGRHEMDRAGRVKSLVDDAGTSIMFRAGMETGTAMIGPLGSRKRKIVTAIGEAVNNASRLESTGIAKGIHVSEKVMNILKQAVITRDTGLMWKIIEEKKIRSVDFFDAYSRFFNIQYGDMIMERKNISYKEFSKDTSFLIRCIPDTDNTVKDNYDKFI